LNDWIYEHGSQHLADLHREAEQERMANQLPHKPGLLKTALSRLFTRSHTDTPERE
jgi:hypothetical protein